jgi:hypothetical protein
LAWNAGGQSDRGRLGLPSLLRPQLPAPAGSHHVGVGAGVSNSRRGRARDSGLATASHHRADLQAVVTHEVYDIDADDLRDLLQRLEARIGAR